jgi:hypothetical protein
MALISKKLFAWAKTFLAFEEKVGHGSSQQALWLQKPEIEWVSGDANGKTVTFEPGRKPYRAREAVLNSSSVGLPT